MDRKEVGIIIIVALLFYMIFRNDNNINVENQLIINSNKIDSLNVKIKDYEAKRNEVQDRIDSVNIIIGELPNF